MNDRIRQLAEQAGFDQHHAEYDTCIKQFAELIVAECLDNCMAANDRDRIREHFGVEE